MRVRFVHFGDVHLGTQQYDSPERLNDFGRAWLHVCRHIANTRPDFAVCTGDLFNRFQINPTTFDQARVGLGLLREAGVPIVDVAGNHDRARYGEGKCWLESFAEQGYLTYLDAELGPEGARLHPVAAGRQVGGFVEWSGCRILGLRYLGASTERALQLMQGELDRLRDGAFTILILHAGLEGIVPNFNAELSAAAIEPLGERVDYLALGHIHKHYSAGRFAHNAGSLETWALNEWSWSRGILEVEVDTDRDPVVSTRLVEVPKRPFCLPRVDVSQYDSPRALLQGCWERIEVERERRSAEDPVVILTLYGRLRFDQSDLPVNQLEDLCREKLDPLVAQVREHFDLRDFLTEGADVDEDEPVDRAVLERAILQARLAEDERYGPRAAELARLAIELKERALRVKDDDGEALRQVLRDGLRDLRADRPAALAGSGGDG